MGIKGLHGLLKSIQKPCHIKKFSGQTLGVDAYGWLHRGTVACSVDLVLENPTRKHLDFVLNRVRMLLFFGVKPYLVFDGDNLPSKAGTEQERARRRQESKALGLELQRKGRMPEAYQEFQKAVDVTPYMARQLIEELKQMNVQYVVAPYEADAQMVYLEQQGDIDGIISEDSDLLVFGAKRLLSKLDQHGECIEINRADFGACREVSLAGWSDADFRTMCILSGCDYLANIPKMGLKTAYRIVRKHRSVEKALRMLQFEGNFRVPPDYLANFKQAELTFLYQRVFCAKAKKLLTLTPPEEGVNLDDMPFIGGDYEPQLAIGVSSGDLDPSTKEPIRLKPWAANRFSQGIHRRQTLGTSSELKSRKPAINDFFTPKRMPLAELDPNTLTPSPSQQRLLERNFNNSWQPNLAPSRSNSVRSTPLRAFSAQGLSPSIRSAERSSFIAQSAGSPVLQATKRQRLCSENEGDSLPVCSPARSRFFTTTSNQASPSGQKLFTPKRSRKSVVGVFSDEDAEDIMTSIPDPTSTPGPTESRTEGKLGTPGQPSGVETPSKPSKTDQAVEKDTEAPKDISQGAPANSPGFNQALEYHVSRQNSDIVSKFTFRSEPKSDTTSAPLVTKSPVAQPTRLPVPPSTPNSPASISRGNVAQRRLTPLQRMGKNALSRSRSLNFPSKLRASQAAAPLVKERSPVAPQCSFMGTQGSEDLMVPDSDEDEESEGESSATPLDLARFSFSAH
ncbi:unnamed protein product [Penicillium salamii]|uniref:Exonuclease 1 n=1 Tax=Penicillium salamii TaxID=1612424 RepID=A0A9W4J6K0_9EURO|nr:unnamed protein product [Penicillium salamii]